MQTIFTDDLVHLAVELETLGLHEGDRGRVCSTWHYPNVAYEVEFRLNREHVRVLLIPGQIREDTSEPMPSTATPFRNRLAVN